MAIFHQLPDSVLQLLAVFLSIIIRSPALRFTRKHLVWLYRSLRDPWKGPKLPAEKQGPGYSLWNSNWFYFPFLWVWDCSHYHALFREKVPSYTAIPFMATAPIINPVVLLRPIRPLGTLGTTWFYVFSELLDCHDFGFSNFLFLCFDSPAQYFKTRLSTSLLSPHLPNHHHSYFAQDGSGNLEASISRLSGLGWNYYMPNYFILCIGCLSELVTKKGSS